MKSLNLLFKRFEEIEFLSLQLQPAHYPLKNLPRLMLLGRQKSNGGWSFLRQMDSPGIW